MPKEEEIVSIQLKSVDPATRDALHQASLSRFEGQKKKKKSTSRVDHIEGLLSLAYFFELFYSSAIIYNYFERL